MSKKPARSDPLVPPSWVIRRARSDIHGHGVYARDIAEGEEISFDYGFRFRHWASNPCRCGAPEYPGYIVESSQRWRLWRMTTEGRPGGTMRGSKRGL